MNILGFVTLFLIITSLTVASFQRSLFDFVKTEYRYDKEFFLLQKKRLLLTRNLYYKQRKTNQKNQTSPTKKAGEKKPRVPKKSEDMPYCARLNLSPLLLGEEPELKKLFFQMIESFYPGYFKIRELDLFYENFILSAKEKKAKGALHPGQIDLHNPKLQYTYYHMLKGNIGPPLFSYIRFDEDPKKKICLSCIDRRMGDFLFGEKVIRELFSTKEKEHERLKISKKALEELLDQKGSSSSIFLKAILQTEHRNN